MPLETNSPLSVDADTVLPLAIAAQRFQLIERWDSQGFKNCCRVQHLEFDDNGSLYCLRQSGRKFPPKKPLGFLAFERSDHSIALPIGILSLRDIIVKR